MQMRRFIQQRQRILRAQIKKSRCRRIEIAQKSLHSSEIPGLLRLLADAEHLLLQAGGLLRLSRLPELLIPLLLLGPDAADAVRQPRGGQNDLGRRIKSDRFQFLNGTLTQNIKAADGIDVVAPELDADRILLRQIIDIDDIAADGELAGTVHLVVALISHGGQAVRDRIQMDGLIAGQGENIFLQHPQRDLRRHQRGESRDDGHLLSLCHPAQAPKPLRLQLPSAEIRLIENEILGRKQHSVPVIEPAVVQNFSRPEIAVCHKESDPGVRCDRLRLCQRIRKMNLLRVRTAIRQNMPGRLLQAGYCLPELC